MRVARLESWQDLQRLKTEWNGLAADRPLLRFEWLGTWWLHYAATNRELYTLVVYDEAEQSKALRAIAPWYRQWHPLTGWTVRFLGSGDVCTDHLSVLCQKEHVESATSAIADWLAAAAREQLDPRHACDAAEWDGVDAND